MDEGLRDMSRRRFLVQSATMTALGTAALASPKLVLKNSTLRTTPCAFRRLAPTLWGTLAG